MAHPNTDTTLAVIPAYNEASRVADVVRYPLGRPVPDNQSGYRLISRRLAQILLAAQETGFEFEVEMIVICQHSGFDIDWVAIRTIYTGGSSHIEPLHHGLHFARMVWRTWRRRKQADVRSIEIQAGPRS